MAVGEPSAKASRLWHGTPRAQWRQDATYVLWGPHARTQGCEQVDYVGTNSGLRLICMGTASTVTGMAVPNMSPVVCHTLA